MSRTGRCMRRALIHHTFEDMLRRTPLLPFLLGLQRSSRASVAFAQSRRSVEQHAEALALPAPPCYEATAPDLSCSGAYAGAAGGL